MIAARTQGSFLKWCEELGGRLRDMNGCTRQVGKPVEVANVLLMRVSGDDLCDFGFQTPQMPGERPSHFGRAWIDCYSVVKNRREQFSEEQWDGVGQRSVQEQNCQLSVEQIKALVMGSSENAEPLSRRGYARPQTSGSRIKKPRV